MRSVAIIMSVYYGDDFTEFKRSVDSMINQTEECDIFICKDGVVSEKINTLLHCYNSRDNINIIENPINRGLAFSLNRLIDLVVSRGYKYIARMDSDDVSYPYRIKKQLVFLGEHPSIDVLGGGCKEFGANFAISEKKLPLDHDNILNFSITRCPLIHPTVMFRSRVFERGFRYPENTSFTEDMALWFTLLSNGVVFANLNDIVLDYKINESTLLRRKGFKKSVDEVCFRLKYMIKLRRFTARNLILIILKGILHVSPRFFIEFMYKHRTF